jgi:hypothetical protein
MSSSGFPIAKTVGLLLVLLVIIISVMIIPSIKSTVDPLLDFSLTDEEKKEAKSGAEKTFDNFVKEYKECKATLQENCRCEVTSFTLPSGYFIEVLNNGGNTRFNLYSGAVSSTESQINGVIIGGHDAPQIKNTIKQKNYSVEQRDVPAIHRQTTTQSNANQFIAKGRIVISEDKVYTDSGEYELYDMLKKGGIDTWYLPSSIMNFWVNNYEKCIKLSKEELESINTLSAAFEAQEGCVTNAQSLFEQCFAPEQISFPANLKINLTDKTFSVIKEGKKVYAKKYSYELCNLKLNQLGGPETTNKEITESGERFVEFHSVNKNTACIYFLSEEEIRSLSLNDILRDLWV